MALTLHFQSVQYIVRGYVRPGGYERREPFALVANVFDLGNGTARIFGAHADAGEFDAATLRTLLAGLAERGIHTALVSRHGIEQRWQTHPPHKLKE